VAARALALLAAALVGGTTDPDDPAVVAIARHRIACDDAPATICTGVLVAPRVVVTAAHCLDGVIARGGLEVAFGADARQASRVIVVEDFAIYGGYDAQTGDGDVAALLLAEDAPVAPIAPPAGSIADVAQGGALRAVGYGVTAWNAGDAGVKRAGALALGDVRAASFDATPAPAMTCVGDSGGPVFAASSGELVGITSRGDTGCVASAVNARYDVVRAPLVDPFVASAASAPPGWPSGIALSDRACASDAECPALMSCDDGHHCGFAWLGDGVFGATCAHDAECGGAPGSRCARVWPDGADACHCVAARTPPIAPDAGGPVPPSDTGCCASSSPSGPSGARTAWLAIVVAIAIARRRRATMRG
jgi:MYXO-CTERM domain-containing protein